MRSSPTWRAAARLASIAVVGLVAIACGPGPDTTPPLLSLRDLTSGDVVETDPATVRVRAIDDRAVAAVAFRTDHGASGPCAAVQREVHACEGIPLPAGPTVVTVRAVDRADNAAELTFVLVRRIPDDTPPTLELDGIEDGATVTSAEITLHATASDDTGVASVAFATDHGSSGACGPPNGAVWPCGPIPLPIGATEIVILARDAAGNEASVAFTVNRVEAADTTPPEVSFSDVSDGDTFDEPQIVVTVIASDDDGVASVSYATNHAASGACAPVEPAAFACGPVPLPEGDTIITVTATDLAGNRAWASVTVRREAAPPPPGFDIEIVFFDETFSPDQRAAFAAAVDRWESLVVGDLEDVTVNLPANGSCGLGEPAYAGTIDDLVIFATSFTEGVGGLLGSAGPCLYRASGADAGTSVVGVMRFDTLDLASLESSGTLVDVIVHEMAHVLGFGTAWEFPPYFELLDYLASDLARSCRDASGFVRDPTFVGADAVAAFGELGGSGTVPVEESGGPGTQCGHWDEERFGAELLTGYLNVGGDNPLSALSVRSLQDVGLTVDASQADPYELPAFPSLRPEGGLDLTAAEQLVRPRGVVDPTTGTIEPRDGATP